MSRRVPLVLAAFALCAVPAALPLATHASPVPVPPLTFGPGQPVDPQRDQSEPNIEIDPEGRIYTCGPTGFTTGADYAQVSTDGGDQFHLLGTPPRGQLADRGGGDCYLATSKEKTGTPPAYSLAYVGLADTDFTTAKSDNYGASFGAVASTCSGATDRQWTTFIDDHTVFVAFNDIGRGELVVQRSVDGGLTYSDYGICGPLGQRDIAPQEGFPGPMKADTTVAHNATNPDTPLVYFGYNANSEVHLAVSSDAGDTPTRATASPSSTTTPTATSTCRGVRRAGSPATSTRGCPGCRSRRSPTATAPT
jgi:hypothetical protein